MAHKHRCRSTPLRSGCVPVTRILGLNQTNTFTFNRYAVKPRRQHRQHSEKPNAGEMVVKNKSQVPGLRCQEKLGNEIRCMSLRPDTCHLRPDSWFFQVFDLPFQARIARHNRSQIKDVDDPGGGIGCKKVSISTHPMSPLIACSRGGPTGIPGHGPGRLRAADSPIDNATSKPGKRST